MNISDAAFRSMTSKIRFAVDNDPQAAGAYEEIATYIKATSVESPSTRDVSDYINNRRSVSSAASAAIVVFSEKHGIRV